MSTLVRRLRGTRPLPTQYGDLPIEAVQLILDASDHPSQSGDRLSVPLGIEPEGHGVGVGLVSSKMSPGTQAL